MPDTKRIYYFFIPNTYGPMQWWLVQIAYMCKCMCTCKLSDQYAYICRSHMLRSNPIANLSHPLPKCKSGKVAQYPAASTCNLHNWTNSKLKLALHSLSQLGAYSPQFVYEGTLLTLPQINTLFKSNSSSCVTEVGCDSPRVSWGLLEE